MNDIYAYDPDTEEEAGQCVDEVIQIAEVKDNHKRP